jgi:hypothetical protein
VLGGGVVVSESLKIIDKGSYLLVEFFGEFGVETGKQCVDRLAEACEKHRRSRALMDCRRMTGVMPLLDRFRVAEYAATKRHQIGRLALLNREDVVLPDNFVENVAVNRGMDMKIFTDLEEAELWLSKSALSKPDADDAR